jgi:predicted glycogen debranching enzyme
MDQKKTSTFPFDVLHSLEYLETNGLGGYASSTFSGAHSRKYHGLLVASLSPPVHRFVMVSKLEETIRRGELSYALGSNQFPGALHPHGYAYVSKFNRHLFPEITFSVPGITIKKTIVAVHGENTTLVIYDVQEADTPFNLELQPFYSARDIHHTTYANDHIGYPFVFEKGLFRTMNYQGIPEIFISVPKSDFIEKREWFRSFEYQKEQERGLEFMEDLYTHGHFSLTLQKGSRVGVIISLNDPDGRDAFKIFKAEQKRREELIKPLAQDSVLQRLALAADQFVVKRGELNTIIAGYPWFSDWGRDTMISLPGLCLVTSRYSEAKKILQKFSEHVKEGLIPNRFPDSGEEPEYNTMDGTLWFFHATYQYYNHTHDKTLIASLANVLREIIEWHYKGTRFNIHVDPSDELLAGGHHHVQLTWMDAKVGDWVVTPRMGKPVEINALWYNALRIMEYFMSELHFDGDAEFYRIKANLVLKNFNQQFWNATSNCLYDYIDGTYKNEDVRPNQIYALSLPFPLLDKKNGKHVIEKVRHELLTTRGLRSLSPRHPDYKGHYLGGVVERDGAYHQGTVWSHLIGAYVDALFYVQGENARAEATEIVTSMAAHLNEAGVGSISEIFDGDPPHKAGGCYAQAWSVAELFRVSIDYQILSVKKKSASQPASIL